MAFYSFFCLCPNSVCSVFMYSYIFLPLLLLFSHPAGEGTVNEEVTGSPSHSTVVIDNHIDGKVMIALLTVNLIFLFLLLAFIIFLVVLWRKVSEACIYLHCKEIMCLFNCPVCQIINLWRHPIKPNIK